MCSSKTEGGKRCAGHSKESVTAGLLSYLAKVTGHKVPTLRAKYDALCQQNVADDIEPPTREEVDAFLVRQIQRVQREPNMTEPRREKILRRLKDALGNILPSAAQFRAWCTLMGEKWNGVKKKAGVLLAVGAMSFSLGACGGGAPSTGDSPTAVTASATQAPGVSKEAAAFIDKHGLAANDRSKWDVPASTISPAVRGALTPKQIKQVDKVVDDMYFDVYGSEGWSAAFLPDAKAKEAIKKATGPYMTAETHAFVAKHVAKYYKTGKGRDKNASWGQASSISNIDIVPSSDLLPASAPLAEAGKITNRKMNLDDEGKPYVTMTTSQFINVEWPNDDGSKKLERYELQRGVKFNLVLEGGKPLIYAWDVSLSMNTAK